MELKFRIKDIRLLESHFKINPDYSFSDNQIKISSSVNIQFTKKDKEVITILSVNSDDKKQPFNFNSIFAGYFLFEKMPPAKELEKIVHINCASILFPYIRETVADLTRRSGIPPFHLSPVNFVNLFEEKQKVEKNKKLPSNK